VFPDGLYYEGPWVKGKREGVGRIIGPDGSLYDGEFRKGNREGTGS